jgi:hypothetical protein
MIKKILFFLLILQSCATAYDEIFVLVKNQSLGYPNQLITLDSFEEAEYSFATFRVGRNPKVKLVLSSIKNNVYQWVSSDKHKIYTYNGLIIKTTGLPHNINLREFRDFNPLQSNNIKPILEFDKPALVGIPMFLEFDSIKEIPDTNIYSNIISYAYLREASLIGWKANGEYWFSNGMAIFSKQNIHPDLAKVEMEFFYKF